MKEKLEACFMRLQGLEIKPTVTNMEALLQSLYDIRDVYGKLKEMEENKNGRSAADPDGRDND